jgi:hypothetical protein
MPEWTTKLMTEKLQPKVGESFELADKSLLDANFRYEIDFLKRSIHNLLRNLYNSADHLKHQPITDAAQKLFEKMGQILKDRKTIITKEKLPLEEIDQLRRLLNENRDENLSGIDYFRDLVNDIDDFINKIKSL